LKDKKILHILAIFIIVILIAIFYYFQSFFLLQRAHIYNYFGKVDRALNAVEMSLEQDSSNVGAYMLRGRIYYDHGFIEEALSPLEQARVVADGSDKEEIKYLKGLILKELERYKEAKTYLEPLAEDGCHRAIINLARVYKQEGAYKDAEKNYLQVVDSNETTYFDSKVKEDRISVYAQAELGQLYQKLERFEEALGIYQNLQEDAPEVFIYFIGYAVTLRNLGRYEEALEILEEARKKYPARGKIEMEQAASLTQQGRWNEAADILSGLAPIRLDFIKEDEEYREIFKEIKEEAGEIHKDWDYSNLD